MIKRTFVAAAALSLLAIGSAHADAEIDGFRSAHFGDNEKAVVDAATADFGVKPADILHTHDGNTKVTALAVKLKNFEPLNLPATLTYVLGYKCNCLTQVSVVWDFPSDITVDQRKTAMMGVGALVQHLQGRGWDKDEVALNRVTGEVKDGSENAVIFFRGQNKAGSAATLLGAPVKMVKKDKKDENLSANVDGIKNILLTYEKDVANPDVYHIDVKGF